MGTIKLISAIMVGFFLSTTVAFGQSDAFSGSFTLKSQQYDAQGIAKSTKLITRENAFYRSKRLNSYSNA